jgi:hypothetical protein
MRGGQLRVCVSNHAIEGVLGECSVGTLTGPVFRVGLSEYKHFVRILVAQIVPLVIWVVIDHHILSCVNR